MRRDIASSQGSQESEATIYREPNDGNRVVGGIVVVDGTSQTAARNARYEPVPNVEKRTALIPKSPLGMLTAPLTVQLAAAPDSYDEVVSTLPPYPSWVIQYGSSHTLAHASARDPPSATMNENSASTANTDSTAKIRITSSPATFGASTSSDPAVSLSLGNKELQHQSAAAAPQLVVNRQLKESTQPSDYAHTAAERTPMASIAKMVPSSLTGTTDVQQSMAPGLQYLPEDAMSIPEHVPVQSYPRPPPGFEREALPRSHHYGTGMLNPNAPQNIQGYPPPPPPPSHAYGPFVPSHPQHVVPGNVPAHSASTSYQQHMQPPSALPMRHVPNPPAYGAPHHNMPYVAPNSYAPNTVPQPPGRGLPAPIIQIAPTRERNSSIGYGGTGHHAPGVHGIPQPPGTTQRNNESGTWQATGTVSVHGPKSVYCKNNTMQHPHHAMQNANANAQQQSQQQQNRHQHVHEPQYQGQLQKVSHGPPQKATGSIYKWNRQESNGSQYHKGQGTPSFTNSGNNANNKNNTEKQRQMSAGRYWGHQNQHTHPYHPQHQNQHQHQRQGSNAGNRMPHHRQTSSSSHHTPSFGGSSQRKPQRPYQQHQRHGSNAQQQQHDHRRNSSNLVYMYDKNRRDSTVSVTHPTKQFSMAFYSSDPNCRNLENSRGNTWQDAGFTKYEPCGCQFCEGLDRSIFINPVFVTDDNKVPAMKGVLMDQFRRFGKIENLRIGGMKQRFKSKNATIK